MILRYCTFDGISGHDAAHALLEQMYLEETGEPLPEIRRSRWGKPYFTSGPYHFSISHTKSHVFCVLSRNNISVDAEELSRIVVPKLIPRILSKQELERYDSAPDPHRALLSLWVLKEAAAKLSGLGLQGFPNDTDFSPDDPRIREIDGCLVAVMEEPD